MQNFPLLNTFKFSSIFICWHWGLFLCDSYTADIPFCFAFSICLTYFSSEKSLYNGVKIFWNESFVLWNSFFTFFSFFWHIFNKPLFKNFHHQRVLICTKHVVSRLVLYFLIAAILKNFSGKRKNALSLVVQESVIISKEFSYTFFYMLQWRDDSK